MRAAAPITSVVYGSTMFFDSWTAVGRVLLIGVLAYAAIVLLLRVSGKRTLSKMNAFDFVVTVALGSTLATVLLSKDVALADGIAAFAALVVLQLAVTWSSVRSEALRRAVKSEPALLFVEGRFLPDALRRERITQDEAEAAVRQSGHASTQEVAAIVLETDGTLSVMGKPHDESVPLDVLPRRSERRVDS